MASQANVAVGFAVPLATGLGTDALVSWVGGSATAVVVGAVGCYAAFQAARVYMRLCVAPVYPRANFYGQADIAPEDPAATLAARRRPVQVCAVAVFAVAVLAAAMWAGGVGTPVGSTALLVGLVLETVLAWHRDAARLEQTLHHRYVLYLRRFDDARSWLVLGTALAASGRLVLAILSPRRVELRSLSWYAFGVLLPVRFQRVRFWMTSDQDWPRVVASCMNSSWAMVLDCTSAPRIDPADRSGLGLDVEFGMSYAFASQHPAAYVMAKGRPSRGRPPSPAVLQVESSPSWLLRRFPSFVGRLRAVLTRQLPADELAYLDHFYRAQARAWREAMVRDRNLALREGRPDPAGYLLARDPRGAILEARDSDEHGR